MSDGCEFIICLKRKLILVYFQTVAWWQAILMDCILSTNFAREQYFWKMYFIYVGLVAYKSTECALGKFFCQLCIQRLQPINFCKEWIFFTDRKSLKMQILTSRGVYDGRVLNKLKRCWCENAQARHTSRVDNTELTFIMSHFGSITTLCMTEKLSHYIQGGGMWGEKKRGEISFHFWSNAFFFVGWGVYGIKLLGQFLVPDRITWTWDVLWGSFRWCVAGHCCFVLGEQNDAYFWKIFPCIC